MVKRTMRLPLVGSRRNFWSDGGEDAVRGLLDVLEALQEQFGISAVKSDIILRCSTGFESDRRADNIGDRFRLRFANALVGLATALGKMHVVMCYFMHQRREGFGGSLLREQGNFALLGHSTRWRDL